MIPADIPNMIALMPHAPTAPAWWMPRVAIEMPEGQRKAAVRDAIKQVEQRRGVDIKDRDVIADLENRRAIATLRPMSIEAAALNDVSVLVHEASTSYAEQQMLIREAKWRVHWSGLMLAALQDAVGAASPDKVVQPVFEPPPVDAGPPRATDVVPVRAKARSRQG